MKTSDYGRRKREEEWIVEFTKEARNLSSSGYLQPTRMNIQPGLFYVLAASLCLGSYATAGVRG